MDGALTMAARALRSNERATAWRWAALGLLLGALASSVWRAPASWVAFAVESLSGSRLMLVEPMGTVWSGSAQMVLSGGPDSADRSALSHRLHWRVETPASRADGDPSSVFERVALQIRLWHPTAIVEPLVVSVHPGWWRAVVQVRGNEPSSAVPELKLPASWLVGLGTPWNTLQPGGVLTLKINRLGFVVATDRSGLLETQLLLELQQFASRIATVPVLGHYALQLQTPAEDTRSVRLTLTSRADSPLQIHGLGRWKPGQKPEFRGEAHAAQGHEAALANLLNIIGRRDGAKSVITL